MPASRRALRAAASAITSYGSLFLGVVKGIIPTPATTTRELINAPRLDVDKLWRIHLVHHDRWEVGKFTGCALSLPPQLHESPTINGSYRPAPGRANGVSRSVRV